MPLSQQVFRKFENPTHRFHLVVLLHYLGGLLKIAEQMESHGVADPAATLIGLESQELMFGLTVAFKISDSYLQQRQVQKKFKVSLSKSTKMSLFNAINGPKSECSSLPVDSGKRFEMT